MSRKNGFVLTLATRQIKYHAGLQDYHRSLFNSILFGLRRRRLTLYIYRGYFLSTQSLTHIRTTRRLFISLTLSHRQRQHVSGAARYVRNFVTLRLTTTKVLRLVGTFGRFLFTSRGAGTLQTGGLRTKRNQGIYTYLATSNVRLRDNVIIVNRSQGLQRHLLSNNGGDLMVVTIVQLLTNRLRRYTPSLVLVNNASYFRLFRVIRVYPSKLRTR